MSVSLSGKPPAGGPAAPSDPVTWATIVRSLAAASAVGAFLGFVGAFNTWKQPLPLRMAFMMGIAIVTTAMGIVAFRLTCRLRWTGDRRFLQGALSGLFLTPFIGVFIWAMTHLMPGGGDPIRALPNYFLNTLVMSEVMTLGAVAMNRRASLIAQAALAGAAAPAPPKFLERLPLKLRGAEVWAVEAEDHYLRLHTSKGQVLILMRLADAIDELAGIEGAQVHRSWWVARDAIAEARRGDGRATLTLKDGSEVPVSRTYARLIREQGWI